MFVKRYDIVTSYFGTGSRQMGLCRPPDHQERAVQLVIEQAEFLAGAG